MCKCGLLHYRICVNVLMWECGVAFLPLCEDASNKASTPSSALPSNLFRSFTNVQSHKATCHILALDQGVSHFADWGAVAEWTGWKHKPRLADPWECVNVGYYITAFVGMCQCGNVDYVPPRFTRASIVFTT